MTKRTLPLLIYFLVFMAFVLIHDKSLRWTLGFVFIAIVFIIILLSIITLIKASWKKEINETQEHFNKVMNTKIVNNKEKLNIDRKIDL